MEENLRRNIPLPSPDHEVMAGCMSKLTQTNSDSSALTVDCSKDFSHRTVNARPVLSYSYHFNLLFFGFQQFCLVFICEEKF